MIGPVFSRELVITPRRFQHFLVYRTIYIGVLLLLMSTAWLVMIGTQEIRNLGDMARFGRVLFQVLCPLQLGLVVFLATLGAVSGVAQEKDRRTLILLLMSRLTNSELVLGKLLASLLNVLVMLTAGLPVFLLMTLFGGISFHQIGAVFAVTLATVLVAGSIGSTIALWREKTFQALAIATLILLLWIGLGEVAASFTTDSTSVPDWLINQLLTGISPVRAILASSRGSIEDTWTYLTISVLATLGLNGLAILRVRRWNPSREIRRLQKEDTETENIWNKDLASLDNTTTSQPASEETARAGHVDAVSRTREKSGRSKRVWNNPVLWREVRTRAYGRKILVIKCVYLLLGLATMFGLQESLSNTTISQDNSVIPAAARPLAPFFLVSLVLINSLGVTSVTNERDGLALDLLLATDISSREFVFGKLGGVLWVTREMILFPLILTGFLWWNGGLGQGWKGGENLVFVLCGLALLVLFVAMLGIHCGMIYANSRRAIGMSLGTVFFLFLGVTTCIVIMVSFSGSFQTQLPPFLAMVLGGGVGLYVALGSRNGSNAILWSSMILPFATFFAITSFVLGDRELTIILVISVAYGFSTLAMLVPALFEFDIAMGRTRMADED